MRVPSIFSWPGVIKSATIDTQMITCDYLPTLVDLAGLDFKPHKSYFNDGISMAPALKGEKKMVREDAFMVAWKRIYRGFYGRAIIDGDYKYMYAETSDTPELYNIGIDPYEKNNIIDKEPEIAAKMEKMFKEFEESFVRSDQGGEYKSY